MLSYHLYSSAYELEYSCLVIIMIYELAYSLCVMILTCSTLCLIIHMICMSRSMVKLRWQFIIPSGLPISFTCRSLGSGTRGDMGSFFVQERGAQEPSDMTVPPGWGVGGRWWQPCLSLVIPHVWVGCRSLNCHTRLLADQYSVAFWPILCSVLALTI